MSEYNEADTTCCASCGIAEIDDVKLVPCDGCDLAKFCSDDCRENHKAEHKEACNKRAAELRDELLFKQPEGSYMGDCPICSLPLSLDKTKSTMHTCCSKTICKGCCYANEREQEARGEKKCPFCRKPTPKTYKQALKLRMKRAKANDPAAMCQEGTEQYRKGYYSRAFEYWTKAAELGDPDAHWKLALLYHDGEVVEKDEGKEIHHYEEAAIGGHPEARFNLGVHENCNGIIERAVKHWIIAATLGDDRSIKALMEAFQQGYVDKEGLAAALREQKAAVEETKSAQRVEAEEFFRKIGR